MDAGKQKLKSDMIVLQGSMATDQMGIVFFLLLLNLCEDYLKAVLY